MATDGLSGDARGATVRRLAVLSLHTSPLAQPGSGSAGGLNVLVAQTAIRLARRGLAVDVFTASRVGGAPPIAELAPGVRVRTIPADRLGAGGAPEARVAPFVEAVSGDARGGPFDLIHSHYWLSGLAGLELAAEWGVPLVHSAHTWARVKNAALPPGDRPEPPERLAGEDRLVAAADRLITATAIEVDQLARLYRADPDRISIVPPGVDTAVFRPTAGPAERRAERAGLGLGSTDAVVVFAGRIQPHKGPATLVQAVGDLRRRHPDAAIRALIVGGRSGDDHAEPDRLRLLAEDLGVSDRIRLMPALPPAELAAVFRAADVVAVPSHSESFGLVALEAQASGTPVVAAAVGGLTVAVADGVSGLLVCGHDPERWADAISSIVLNPGRRATMALAARRHAARFSWEATAEGLLGCYRQALIGRRPAPCR